MGYDIRLIDKNSKKVLKMKTPQYVRGSLMKAEWDEQKQKLIPVKTIETELSVTSNYAKYYYEAAENDKRFYKNNLNKDKKSENLGIKALQDKTALESMSMLYDMIKRISNKYQDKDGNWIISDVEETRTVAYDKKGNVVPLSLVDRLDILKASAIAEKNGKDYEPPFSTIKQEKCIKTVDEGDTNNYWEATAANALLPLYDMLHMATEHLGNKNALWDIDY